MADYIISNLIRVIFWQRNNEGVLMNEQISIRVTELKFKKHLC